MLKNTIELAKEYLEIETIKSDLVEFANLRDSGVSKAEELGLDLVTVEKYIKELKAQYTVELRQQKLKELNNQFASFIASKIEDKLVDPLNQHSREELEENYAIWYLGWLKNSLEDKETQNKRLARKIKSKVIEEVNDIDELLDILDI